MKGIWADEAARFHPSQWVNVYKVDVWGDAVYSSSCQVKDLELDEPSEYGLEPTDAEGNLISVKTALLNAKLNEIK